MSEVSKIGLAAALDALREELENSWQSSQGKSLRFQTSAINLTMETVARFDKEGGGKIRWWLVEAGGSAKTETETTQTLVLTLTPTLYDEQGRQIPLEVSALQERPGD